MKKMFLIAALFVCAAAMPAKAQSDDNFSAYVEVSGYAERSVTPDTFYLNIVISESDSKGKISVEKQQQELIRTLKQAGVDTDERLTMVDMSGQYFKKSNTLLTAHYRLKLSSAADVRKVYAALSDIGISSVSMRSFSYSQIDKLRDELRVEAMHNARNKAAVLAEAVGQNIGDCIRINDYSRDATEESVMMSSALFKAAGNTDIAVEDADEEPEFKPIKVASSLNARFTLLGSNGQKQ